MTLLTLTVPGEEGVVPLSCMKMESRCLWLVVGVVVEYQKQVSTHERVMRGFCIAAYIRGTKFVGQVQD